MVPDNPGGSPLAEGLLPTEQSTKAVQQVPGWQVLAVLAGVAFTSNVIISLIAPILPQHFEQIGVPQIWCGVMFSGFPVAGLLCSPVAVRATAAFGRVPVLVCGLLLQGATAITFGLADDLTGGPGVRPHAALVIYTLSRLGCGAGGALANNSIFSIAADRFPDTLAKVMSLNEVVIGAGFSLGPPIGNALFLHYGFAVAFITAGCSILAFTPFALMLWRPHARPRTTSETDDSGGLCEVLTPGLLVAGFSLLLGTGVFGIVEPILSLYLQDEVGVEQGTIGTIFAAFAASYSLSGPFMGSLADNAGALHVCTSGGLASGLIMVLLLGPEARSFPSGSVQRVCYEVAALLLLGVSQAATLIPSLPAMQAGANSVSNATDRVVAWFNMFMQLGLAVAPPIATALSGVLGFELVCVLCGSVIAAYGAFAVAFASRASRSKEQPALLRTPSRMITGVPRSPFEPRRSRGESGSSEASKDEFHTDRRSRVESEASRRSLEKL